MDTDSERSTGQSHAQAMEITDEERFGEVLETEERVLVDFYADWCGPCRMVAPTVEEFASETEAAVVKVNVEELLILAYRYDVESIPTFLGFADGEVVGRRTGMQQRDDLQRLLE